jgi:hypothetical protein
MHDSLVFALVAKILVCVPPPLLGQLMDGFGGKAIESSGIQIQLLLYQQILLCNGIFFDIIHLIPSFRPIILDIYVHE